MKNSVKKNFVFQIFYQILMIIAPLITAPYIARVLGPDKVGINSYSYAITSYFVMFGALGIENYGSRLIAQNKSDKKSLNKVFSELFLTHVCIAIIVYLLFIFYCIFIVKDNNDVFLVQSFYVLGIIFDINWLYFGLEEFQKVVIKNCVLKVLSVILVFILVKKPDDLIFYVGILSISTFINYSVLWLGIKSLVKFVKVDFNECLKHVKPLFILFLPAIAILLYKYMDKIMLGNICDSASVGYYDSGERIIVLSSGLINALGVVMLPRISTLKVSGNETKIHEYFEKSIIMIGMISIACCFGAYGIANDFVPFFFGEGYEPSIMVMKVLAFTLPFSAFANVVKTQYTLPNKKDTFFAATLISGAVINFIINFCLIPKLEVLGATIGTVVTEVFVCMVQVIKSNKEMKTFKSIFKIFGFLISAIVMIFIMSLFNDIDNIVLKIVLKVFFGGISYILIALIYVLIVYKKLVTEIVTNIQKKINRL